MESRLWNSEYDGWAEIHKITQITPTLFLGGEAGVAASRLLALGIKGVLNVAKEIHDVFRYGEDLASVHFPFKDRIEMAPWMVEEALRCLKAMEKSGPVYVHCGVGVSRSPTILGLYLFATGRAKSLPDALRILEEKRPCVNPSRDLMTPEVWAVAVRLKKNWAKKNQKAVSLVG